jgi:hypothetical protein
MGLKISFSRFSSLGVTESVTSRVYLLIHDERRRLKREKPGKRENQHVGLA